jgi:hypothetical protein
MGKKSASGSGMNNPNHIFEVLRNIFWGVKKYLNSLNADPGFKKFGSGIWDGKNSYPGSGINIPDNTDNMPSFSCQFKGEGL